MEQDRKKEIEELVGQKCQRDFKCYKFTADVFLKAKDIGSALFLDCLEENPIECQFSISFGYSYFCRCPLRVFISKNLKK
jgi:hypothetical protein